MSPHAIVSGASIGLAVRLHYRERLLSANEPEVRRPPSQRPRRAAVRAVDSDAAVSGGTPRVPPQGGGVSCQEFGFGTDSLLVPRATLT
eukprot:6663998-Prymnesium_polylepis.1